MPSLDVWRLGRVEYEDGLELQRQFVEARRAGASPDTLLLLEHPPVLTLGRGAHPGNVLASPERLRAQGVEVFPTDRGGDVTYHGPGQVVGYPLLHLGPGRQDVRRYVRSLEEVVIRTLAEYGVAAQRIARWPGVWVDPSRRGGPRKICALGVHLSRWYTRHGFALNVGTDLSHFELIVPCGIREASVTSLEAELGRAVALPEVEAHLARHFGAVFECEVRPSSEPIPTVGVVIHDGRRALLLRRTAARGGFWQPVTGRVEPGELPGAAAGRELAEETGFTVPAQPLGYWHTFAWGVAQPPRVARETFHAARVEPGSRPALSDEHDAFEWVPLAEALSRVPFAGFRAALRLALEPATAGSPAPPVPPPPP
jgi:lipoyl(octanoyl) transferase